MASYQDIETRLAAVERLVRFMADVVRVPVSTSALSPAPVPMRVSDLYRLVNQQNLNVIDSADLQEEAPEVKEV